MNEAGNSPTMAKLSRICGIIAVISIFSMTIYPAMILGSIAVILALLSRGEKLRLSSEAMGGFSTGIVALTVNIALVIIIFLLLFFNGEYRDQVNTMVEQMYGYTLDDIIEDLKDGSIDLDLSAGTFQNPPF